MVNGQRLSLTRTRLRFTSHASRTVGQMGNGYLGKFNLRISPELHEKLAIAAQAEGKSINTLAQEALARRVAA